MKNIITEIVGTMLILPNTHINARNKNYSMLTIGIRRFECYLYYGKCGVLLSHLCGKIIQPLIDGNTSYSTA